jgi:hypothetical protein
MAQNKPNKSNSQTEVQSSQEALELILKLLPMLNTKQLGCVLESVAEALQTAE